MPHLILEHSDNILEKDAWENLFESCHSFLAATLPTDSTSCKSRAIACTDYLVGLGMASDSFVHVSVKVMPGRSQEVLRLVGEGLMEILQEYFVQSIGKLNLQISLELTELGMYFKKAK